MQSVETLMRPAVGLARCGLASVPTALADAYRRNKALWMAVALSISTWWLATHPERNSVVTVSNPVLITRTTNAAAAKDTQRSQRILDSGNTGAAPPERIVERSRWTLTGPLLCIALNLQRGNARSSPAFHGEKKAAPKAAVAS